VTTKNAVFWDVMPCCFCKNRHFGGSYRLQHEMKRIRELGTTLAVIRNRRTLRRNTRGTSLRRVLQVLLTANFPSSLILFFLMMVVAIRASETSVLTRSVLQLLVTAKVVHSSQILFAPMMVTRSSETSVLNKSHGV
jgi:hypothetical protein